MTPGSCLPFPSFRQWYLILWTCSLGSALSRTERSPQFRSLFIPPTLARSDLRTVGPQLLENSTPELPDPGRAKRVTVDSLVTFTTNAVTFQMPLSDDFRTLRAPGLSRGLNITLVSSATHSVTRRVDGPEDAPLNFEHPFDLYLAILGPNFEPSVVTMCTAASQ
ncbi:hypothetical protein BJY52DRAFT_795496 [Lactarius psammicola]|nr:hypothetical protein BJY52DRAFT_795496 [Lactarius psammicola]